MIGKSYSLKTILISLFLAFAIIPMGIVSFYALYSYNQMAEQEQLARLAANKREIQSAINGIEKDVRTNINKYKKNSAFAYYISLSEFDVAKKIMISWMSAGKSSSMKLYNRNGYLVVSLVRNKKNKVIDISAKQKNIYNLNEAYKKSLEDKTYFHSYERKPQESSFYITSKVFAPNGRFVGYIQESSNANNETIKGIGSRVEAKIINAQDGKILLSSFGEMSEKDKKTFVSKLDKKKAFSLEVANEPYIFKSYSMGWGESQFDVYLGVSKKIFKKMISNAKRTFMVYAACLSALLFILSLLITDKVIRPVSVLVDVLKNKTLGEEEIQVSSDSATEFRVLTESFNEMSKKVYGAQSQLRGKVTDLEEAQSKVKETQSQLVHSAKMASLGQLVAGVAHELNNPIGFMYSNTSFLSKYVNQLVTIIDQSSADPKIIEQLKEEADYEYIKKDIGRIVESFKEGSQRTKDIVLGLRNFSRLEEAKLKEVKLEDGIDSTIKLLESQTKNKIKIIKSYQPVGFILCYPSQLNQVFMNLLSNAIQAIDGTGEIVVKTLKTNEVIEIKIKDSGSGMTEEVVQRIFEPFYTTKDVGKGTGLGLSLSYGIVQKHKGDIYVKSEPGLGTEFVIHLPIDGPEALS